MRPSILRLDKHPGRKLTAPRVSHIAGAGSVIDQEVLAERELPCSGTLPGCRRHLRHGRWCSLRVTMAYAVVESS